MRKLILFGLIALGATNLSAAKTRYGNKEEAELMNILQYSLQNADPFVDKVRNAVSIANELNNKAAGTPSQNIKSAGERILIITTDIANILSVLKATPENSVVEKQKSLISQLALKIIGLRKTLATNYVSVDRQKANALLQKVSSPVTKLLGLAQNLANK